MREGNVFRTYIVAAAAAHAHMMTMPLFVTMHLMQNLKSHSFAVFLSVAAAACHIGKFVDHTGRPDPSALTDVCVVRVMYILHGKAGTGRTDKITSAAGYAALIVLFPHGGTGYVCSEIFGNFNNRRVFTHPIRCYLPTRYIQIKEKLFITLGVDADERSDKGEGSFGLRHAL